MRALGLLLLLAWSSLLLADNPSRGGEPAEPAFSSRQRGHWAFQPVKRPPLPRLSSPNGVVNAIDVFIRHRLTQAGLAPAPAADRATLLRRVTFDLTGLPPTLRELDDFLNDTRDDAYVRVVDRLLASPHYGERWGRHWLDAAGYADSVGGDNDPGQVFPREGMWRYRDYVVRALNEDKPFDRFLVEQLAGDELDDWRSASVFTPRRGPFPARARAMVHFMQNGGPSQMDFFDPKPELQKRSGQSIPASVEIYQKGNSDKLLASPFPFRPRGACGMELSDALPQLTTIADDITLVRSMYTEHNNHTEALVMMSTGKLFQGRPALGAWINYALGTENQNLPAYVVLRDPAGYNTSGKLVWSSGWLPALYQGTEFSSTGSPVLNLQPAQPLPAEVQRDSLNFLAELNHAHLRQYPGETELEARIRNYELAARMQLKAAESIDLSRETAATRKLYALDNPVTASYGTRCLMARRLIEAGVRFVQVFPPVGQPWDAHADTRGENEKICAITDGPVAGFIKDLKSRGVLDDTLVLWTGEFGRLPVSQNGKGRDHNRNAFSLWLAGGGFKPGYVHGATDDFGYKAVVDRGGCRTSTPRFCINLASITAGSVIPTAAGTKP